MESRLRRRREEIHLLEKCGASEGDINAAKAKYHALSDEYAEFSKAFDLPQQRERINIQRSGGVDVSFGKPLEKPEKPVEKSGENGIIKEKIISASNNEKTNKENTSKISNSESKTEESIDYSRVGSRSFSKEAQTRMLQQERIISGQKYETGILYKSNGEVSFSKKGKADEVHFTKSEIEKMKGCVLTHNHPNGSVFSPEDINILRRGQLAEIRACNGKGAYVLRSNSEWSSEISDLSSIKDAYWDCYEQAGMKYRDIAAQEGKHILLYMRRIEEEGISSFAKKFNLEFTWEAKL